MDRTRILKEYVRAKDCLKSKQIQSGRRRRAEDLDEDLSVPGVDPFLIDGELKIAQSKAVRRLLDKTQVLTIPHNLHVRRRITHSGEVTAISSFMSSVLGLNVELTKAIALGHDIGHPPFGHDGEAFLDDVSNPAQKFKHEIMGVVIAQHIERNGNGLNLTREVLEGFVRDAWPGDPRLMSEEAKVVMWADRFAYITGDYNDMCRIGYEVPNKLREIMKGFGENQRQRVNTLMSGLCVETAENGAVFFEHSEVAEKFARVKKMMYEIYPRLNASNSRQVLERIFNFIRKVIPNGVDPIVVLALMTDHDVLYLASQPVLDYSHFRQATVFELLPLLGRKEVCWWDPDLNW